jgi:SH3-like domain-containing protein
MTASRPTAPAAARFLGLALALALLGGPASARAPSPSPPFDRAAGETPSRLPVPRLVSLRYSKVNARAGPDSAYPVRWVYTRRGLPVRVTAETEEWRRIQDPEGSVVWVHKRMLDARRTAVVRPSGAARVGLHRDPRSDARVTAWLADGVIGEVVEARPGWRKLRVGKHRGWVRASEMWGADVAPSS